MPTAEYNPFECVKTNIVGAMDDIDAALDQKVKKVVALSTDKRAVHRICTVQRSLHQMKCSSLQIHMQAVSRHHFRLFAMEMSWAQGDLSSHFVNKQNSEVFPITDERMTVL